MNPRHSKQDLRRLGAPRARSRRRRSLLVAVVATVVALVAGTALQASAAEPRGLAGVRVVWPAAAAPAGSPFALRVSMSPRRRRGRPVRVRLWAMNTDGSRKVLSARRLRDGVFRARLPGVVGERLLLTVDSGESRKSRVIMTTEPSGPSERLPEPRPATGREPPPPQPPQCPQPGAASARLEPQPTGVRRGERLEFALLNTGESCVTFDAEFRYERESAAGGWEPTGPPMDFPAYAGYLQPGQRVTDSATIPPDLQPGRHRVVKQLTTGDGALRVAGEFDVLP